MRTKAAVAVAAGKPLEILDVNLDGPRTGEVPVEIKAPGLCHTDEFSRSGGDPMGTLPAILGHKGAGVLVEVGEGVTSPEVEDHVIPLSSATRCSCRISAPAVPISRTGRPPTYTTRSSASWPCPTRHSCFFYDDDKTATRNTFCWHTTVAEQNSGNIHVGGGGTRS